MCGRLSESSMSDNSCRMAKVLSNMCRTVRSCNPSDDIVVVVDSCSGDLQVVSVKNTVVCCAKTTFVAQFHVAGGGL